MLHTVNMEHLPALNENQAKKLKLLSIATLSESQQVIVGLISMRGVTLNHPSTLDIIL